MNVMLVTHITLGYGSPEMLNLYNVLVKSGHNVCVSDQEDNIRDFYQLPGVKRLFRRNVKKLEGRNLKAHMDEVHQYVENFKPDIVVSSFLPFIQDPKFPLNKGKYKIFYAAEVFPDVNLEGIDCIVSPNEDRLSYMLKGKKDIENYTVYNCPLLSDKVSSVIKNPQCLNVLYQGQISRLSGVDVLLKALELTESVHLHICGDIRDEGLKSEIFRLSERGKLTYHGFLKQHELNSLREICHLGFIGWREDLADFDITYKYCCPTKLYDYIAHGMPVIYLKNYALDKWNGYYQFGKGVPEYDCHISLSELLKEFLSSKNDLLMRLSKRCVSLSRTSLNYEYQVKGLVDYIGNIK